METGYYADNKYYTKVHVLHDGKPICGSVIGKKMSFQWCSHDIKFDYIECERCKTKARKILKARVSLRELEGGLKMRPPSK